MPAIPALRFQLGRLKLEAEDSGGVAHLEEAMSADPQLVYGGCELLYGHFRRTNQPERAMEYIQRAQRQYNALRGAERERDG